MSDIYEEFHEYYFRNKIVPDKKGGGYNTMDMNNPLWQLKFKFWKLFIRGRYVDTP